MNNLTDLLRRPIILIPVILLITIAAVTIVIALSLLTQTADSPDTSTTNVTDVIATPAGCRLQINAVEPLYDEPDETTLVGELETGIYPVIVIHGNEWVAVDWRGDNPAATDDTALDWVQPDGGVDSMEGDCNDVPLRPVPLATGTAQQG